MKIKKTFAVRLLIDVEYDEDIEYDPNAQLAHVITSMIGPHFSPREGMRITGTSITVETDSAPTKETTPGPGWAGERKLHVTSDSDGDSEVSGAESS